METYRSKIAPNILFSNIDLLSSGPIASANLPVYASACPSSSAGFELVTHNTSIDSVGVYDLQRRYAGYGKCLSCGASGSLYGCGVFCRTCNNIWCWEYLDSKRALSYKEVNKMKLSGSYRRLQAHWLLG